MEALIRKMLCNGSLMRLQLRGAALGNIIAGPITGPTIKKAKEGESSAEFYKTSLQPGSIPPHTFREGAIFFETSKKQPKTLKVSLGNLWPETFLFEFKK